MNEQAIKKTTEKFDSLYAKMSVSNNIEDMKLFGRVMRKAMVFLTDYSTEKVEELIEELCAINWHNYLTKKETGEIVGSMEPKAAWTMEQAKREVEAMGMPIEEMPYYNWCALYTTISMICSDSGETLKKYAFGEVADDKKLFALCYHLAVDKLKDKDEVFNIRKYFGL